MQNYICDGERMVVTLSAPANSGDVIVIGTKIAIALNSGNIGDNIAVMNEGVFELAKAVGAITQGQVLYFDDTNNVITTVAQGNLFIGYAYIPAANADATVQVLVVDNPPTGPANNIAPVSVANATDLPSTLTLVNQLKTTVNGILTALKSIDLMVHD